MATEEQTTRTNPLLREGYRKAEEEPPPQNTPHNSTPKNSGGIHGVTNEPESHESAEAQEVCSPTKPTVRSWLHPIWSLGSPSCVGGNCRETPTRMTSPLFQTQ